MVETGGSIGLTGDTVATADTAGVAHTSDTATNPSGPTVELLPAPSAASCGEFPTTAAFVDVTSCAGLDNLHVAAVGNSGWSITGQALADLDQDGWLDVLVTSFDGSNRVFRGSDSGAFIDVTPAALQGLVAGPIGLADMDGDGDRDAYFGGAGEGWLLENVDGVLSPIPGPSNTSMATGVAWGDLFGDGTPELYVTHYPCFSCFASNTPLGEIAIDEMFELVGGAWVSRGDLISSTIFERAGFGFSTGIADWDDDGDPDLMVVNDKGAHLPDASVGYAKRNVFFRNDGPGCGGWCFTEVAQDIGADLRVDGMGLARADFDRDGDLDVAVSDDGPVWLLRNDGGQFTEVASAHGIVDTSIGWGIAFADTDNDGFQDLVVAGQANDRLYRWDGVSFSDETAASGLSDERFTAGLSIGDYDRDGRVDLLFGDYAWSYRLMRNVTASPGAWVGVELVGIPGTPGGTDGLGARLRVIDSDGNLHLRDIQSGDSLGGGSDLGMHIGLGPAGVSSAEVVWPDGQIDPVSLTLNRWHRIRR